MRANREITRAVAAAIAATTIAATTPAAAQTPATPADETRALAAEMLADAESRSSLLQSAATAGHDGGFFIASPDGAFDLRITALLQFRYELNSRDGNSVGDDFTTGFNNPRTILYFKGSVHEDIGYQVRMNFSRTTGAAALDDAFVTFRLDDNWSLRLGQGIHAFDREWFYGDVKLQTVERSLAAYHFGGGRIQGAMFTHQADSHRAFFSLTDGLRSLNSDLGASPADIALTARAELKLAGSWAGVSGPLSSPPGGEDALALGGALHYEIGPDVGATEQELFAWTADINYKSDGWNLFAAATGYHTTDEAGVSGADFDEYGLVAQGGFFFQDDKELYARYTLIIPDSARAPADDDFHALALGLNWFIHGHAARFTIQGEWFPEPTTDTIAGNFAGTGGRTPANSLFGTLASDDGDQLALTAQFQLIF